MDLSQYGRKEILLTALKAEIESEKAYRDMANRVRNQLLSDRLMFLAREENKHAAYVKSLYKEEFLGEEPEVPEELLIPLPEIDIENKALKMSELFEQSIEAEKTASVFYSSMISIFHESQYDNPEDKDLQRRLNNVRGSLLYLATMEMGHARMLETEAEFARQQEQNEEGWDMIHLGP